MKKILITLMMVFMAQGWAVAEEDKGPRQKFKTMKEKALESIGKSRSLLNELESCIKSAKSREDIKSCRQINKQGMETLRSRAKAIRQQRKEMREQRNRE